MIKVFLREKKLLRGRRGLYLDFYPPIVNEASGKQTRRQHLGLYIYEKPKNTGEREHNKETRMLGEAIRGQRQLELQAGAFGFVPYRNKQKDFIEYFTSLAETKRKSTSKSNYDTWICTSKHLKSFAGEKLSFGQVTETLCQDFKSYLLKQSGLSHNTASQYFDKFKAAIREATDSRLLPANPARRVKSIKAENSQREFLTIDELKRLSQTEFRYQDLRRAALFSALTGLRYSDIAKLTWSEVQHSTSHGYSIRFRQKKTRATETLPISDEAAELLGKTGTPNEVVFGGLHYWQCSYLNEWTTAASISKKITFHCFRHTYATLQLTLGTDIYTISKLLGHRNLKTTQIYAQVIDRKKREAADRIKLK